MEVWHFEVDICIILVQFFLYIYGGYILPRIINIWLLKVLYLFTKLYLYTKRNY